MIIHHPNIFENVQRAHVTLSLSHADPCRYHYNVSGHRLDVHVAKGVTDGLFISSVGCAGELWAVIMDAGTGFTSQVYSVTPNAFLPKEWIMDKWDQGFYITAVAGTFHFGLVIPRPQHNPPLSFLLEFHSNAFMRLLLNFISKGLPL